MSLLASIWPAYRRIVERLRETRDALAAARRTAAASKLRTSVLERKIERLRKRLTRLESSNRSLKGSLAARTLSPLVLEESIAPRLDALRQSSRRAEADALDDHFASRSDGYRQIRDMGGERRATFCEGPFVFRGLQMWIPRQGVTDPNSLESKVASGRLPFRTILSTRDLAQGTIMLDIGANIGTTSIPRVVLGDFQCVYAAEPEPANYTCLVQNIVANGLTGFILPDRVAIGSASGRVAMELAPRIGAHRLVGGREPGAGPTLPGHVSVRSLTLDDWIDSLALDPSLIAFIKCDVQGWESNVLAGAPRTLQHRHIAWQLEVSPKHLRHAGSSLYDFCRMVQQQFDRFIDLGGEGRRSRSTSDLPTSLDYLSTHRRFTDILVYNT
jgi:FkbM family methyltransferase